MKNSEQEKLKNVGEISAVKKFKENKGLIFDENLLNSEVEEPADVVYDNEKYQIVSSNFDFEKEIRIEKFYTGGGNPKEVFNKWIDIPLKHKSEYGSSAKGHILIIYSKTYPQIFFDYSKKNFDIGFDKVYFVTQEKNIKLFPK